MEQPQQNQPPKAFINYPVVSLVLSICALFSCCTPPAQFFCGACAVMAAVLSRRDHTFSTMARIGLVIGILSIVCSVLIFVQYVATMRIMGDPANAALVKEVTRYYQEFMNQLQAQ